MVGTVHKYKTNESTGKLICPYCCEYEALKQSTMSEHVRQKHTKNANRPVVSAVCPHVECGRSFNTISLLRNHLASKAHSQDCSSHTSIISLVSQISIIAAPSTNFSCEKCDACFAKKGQLINHFVRFHLSAKEMVVPIDSDHSKCTHCSKVMKKCTMTYHLGICNPASPFSKDACQTQVHTQIQVQKEEEEQEQEQEQEDEDQDQEDEDQDLDFAEFEMFIRSTSTVSQNQNQNQTSIDNAALMAIITRQIDLQSIVLRAI